MHRSHQFARLTAPLLALLLAASACSGGSDDPAASSDADASEATATEAASEGEFTDTDCEIASAANLVLRRDTGWLGAIDDEASLLEAEELGRDLQPLVDAVEALRPYQDIDVDGFGTMRESLDSVANDVAAVREGRFADKLELPVIVVVGVTVGEVVCA